MINDSLLGIRKPARYIGQEWNVSKKDFAAAVIRFVICFPDTYEVGMSNLGLRILYAVLNNIEDVCCERSFAPAADMELFLRQNNTPLWSLESQRSLSDFDMIGFSLGYELGYTNVLNMLDLCSIPLRSQDRDRRFPLIIGGGPAVMNPEPVADFFDLFVIGEGEDVIAELIEVYRRNKEPFRSGRLSKESLLLECAQVPGVYAPSLYTVAYDQQGTIAAFSPTQVSVPEVVVKRVVKDLNASLFPVRWLTPYIQVVHDRITLEISRGCPNRCRFCQARSQYYPLRYRTADTAFSLACQAYRNSGYEEISLSGLSVSDYPQLKQLLTPLIAEFKSKGVGFSLPSIKPKSFLGDISGLIATIKKTGLTFAPEAATDVLRQRIGKDFDSEEFFSVLEGILPLGYQHVKLYFMIGLPGETEEDVAGIADFAQTVSGLGKKVIGRPIEVNISVNTVIPKPHTAFQWLPMISSVESAAKQSLVRSRLKSRKLKVSFHQNDMSYLEGIFSRGDRRLAAVIERAFRAGCRFDGWQEQFKPGLWRQAFEQCGIEPQRYLRARPLDEILPWDFIDVGIPKEYFVEEYKKLSG
jgi:radical SAM family uncharacterized protein